MKIAIKKNPTSCVWLFLFFYIALSLVIVRGQDKGLLLTNSETGREIVFKEGKRVKIITDEGRKIAGRIRFEADHIFIKDNRIAIEQIAGIKRHPLLLSILGGGVMIYAGVVTIGIGTLIAVYGQPTGALLIIPGVALVFGGLHPPNLSKMHYIGSQASIQIISLIDKP